MENDESSVSTTSDLNEDHRYTIDDFVEYRPGNSNIILSVPHGGKIDVREIPNRIPGCHSDSRSPSEHKCQFHPDQACLKNETCRIVTRTDLKTIEIADIISNYLTEVGKSPHVIICHLRRTKIDCNREINEAAQNNPTAVKVYQRYHQLIENVSDSLGTGILFDIHGQGHKQNSTELGYLLSKSILNLSEYNSEESSIKSLANSTGLTGEELMIGSQSFGAFIEEQGYHAVPSPRQPFPGEDKYYRGGYITRTHGSAKNGKIDAIQIEMPSETRVEGGKSVRNHFATSIAKAIEKFHNHYYTQELNK